MAIQRQREPGEKGDQYHRFYYDHFLENKSVILQRDVIEVVVARWLNNFVYFRDRFATISLKREKRERKRKGAKKLKI